MPVYPFPHSQSPLERQFPRPLQLLGQVPAKIINSKPLTSYNGADYKEGQRGN